jgi:hypothetical protein
MIIQAHFETKHGQNEVYPCRKRSSVFENLINKTEHVHIKWKVMCN